MSLKNPIAIDTPQQLAQQLMQANSWEEVAQLTRTHGQLKVKAWQLLSTEQQQKILRLKEWKSWAIAQDFPLGCRVQRRYDPEQKQGTVIEYWRSYGVEYAVFIVDGFFDWCPGSMIERIDIEE